MQICEVQDRDRAGARIENRKALVPDREPVALDESAPRQCGGTDRRYRNNCGNGGSSLASYGHTNCGTVRVTGEPATTSEPGVGSHADTLSVGGSSGSVSAGRAGQLGLRLLKPCPVNWVLAWL